jgi:sporulation protein YlmC with PRC-barrel domain
MYMFRRIAFAGGFLLLVATAHAQERATRQTAREDGATRPFGLMTATRALGEDVAGPDGAKLGSIKDLAIDLTYGRVAFALLELDPPAGDDKQRFPVPWTALSYPPEGREPRDMRFTLNVSRDLKDAVSIPADKPTELTAGTLGERVYAFYDARPYWDTSSRLRGEPTSLGRTDDRRKDRSREVPRMNNPWPPVERRIVTANIDLMHREVNHASNNENLGQISDLLIDRNTGDIAFVVVRFHASSSVRRSRPDREFAALPYAMFQVPRGRDNTAPIMIECCLERVKQNAFSENQWPDLSSQAWARSVFDSFGRPPYWEKPVRR